MIVITANALRDGRVIYLGTADNFVDRLSDAKLFADKTEAEAALACLKRRTSDIADAYLIAVTESLEANGREALRETIRDQGPTIRRDLGKQSLQG